MALQVEAYIMNIHAPALREYLAICRADLMFETLRLPRFHSRRRRIGSFQFKSL